MKVRIDVDEITLDDLIELEAPTLRFMKAFLARFLVDEAGASVPEVEAQAQIGKLKMKEINGFIEQVKASVEEAVGNAVPPRKSGS